MTDNKNDEMTHDLPPGLGQPALRALTAAGYTHLEQFASVTEGDLLKLHGVGPKAIRLIRSALDAGGQSFAERRPVVLVPHDPAWKQLAAEEAARVAGVLGSQLVAIHHIGSTAIPGIRAKPILDLLGVVNQIQVLDENAHVLERLDYRPRGELGIPGRRYFSKPQAGTRTHHLHCFEQGDPNIDRHLLFRDYLLAHPNAAADYDRLKAELAARYPNDSLAYTDAKTDFIRAIERSAVEWRQSAPGSDDRIASESMLGR